MGLVCLSEVGGDAFPNPPLVLDSVAMDTIGVARLNMEVSSSLIDSCDLVGGVAGLCRDFG